MLKKLMTTCFVVLLVSIAFTIVTPNAHASAPTKVYVDPPAVVNQALVPGTTFNISIKVDDIPVDPGVVGVQFNLSWNPSIINATSMEEVFFHSTMPPDEVESNLWKIKHVIAASYVLYGYTYQDINRAINMSYGPVSGNQTIAKITMRVNGIGKCALHLEKVVLGDPEGIALPIDVFDGFFSNTPSPPPALLYVDPPSISNVNLTPCNNFTVNVNIMNASGIYGLEFKLSFNATMLQVNSVTKGSFIPPSSTPTIQIDNTAGFITFNVSVSSSLDGDGTLAEVDFHVESLGDTALHIYDVQLVDNFGEALPYATSDGSFNNVLLAKIAVDPAMVIDPTLVPPATFTINVTIAEVRDLYAYAFNLTFDPSILICLQVQIHDVLNEAYYIPNQAIDNWIGFVAINVTYYPPAVPLDIDPPTPFVSIKFRVKAIGGTNLTLTDTQLLDSAGQPMTHQVFNGYFQSLIVDVAVTNAFADPITVYKGRSTNITITVENQGNMTVNFTLEAYYNSTLMAAVNVSSLAPGASTNVTIVWNTGAAQGGKYIISAQVPPLQYETDVADNTFIDGIVKIRIPGDLNGDDVVDILDAIMLSNAFGTSPGDPAWNPDADLNGDGIVDIIDAILLANSFGFRI